MAIIESREYYEPEGSLTVIFPFQRHGYRTLNGGQHNVICIDPRICSIQRKAVQLHAV
ncbi:MAG: hypothetical protein ACLR5G_13510 [Eubacteriales bacterium]